MNTILHKNLSYEVVGILFYIHGNLGRYCNHNQYCDAIEIILKKKKISYEREFEVAIEFENEKIFGNKLDFLIDNKIVLDVKCKKEITKKDYVQMKRYLRASEKELGIIVNFAEKTIKPIRILHKLN